MQKLITKYGLAAHLAFLAVAPLFLSPSSVLTLAALAMIWIVLEPSRVGDEMLHDARKRVLGEILHDWLFWVTLILVVTAGVRALNDGVKLAYDAEIAKWFVSPPSSPFLPGSTEEAGYPFFAAVVSVWVLLQGCRHALGRSARYAMTLLMSAIVGGGMLVEAWCGIPEVSIINPAFRGVAAGLSLVVSSVALTAVFERRWWRTLPLMAIGITGSAIGAFLFNPPIVIALYVGGLLVVMSYNFIYLRIKLGKLADFRHLVVFGVSLAAAVALIMYLLPEGDFNARIDAFTSESLWPENYLKIRGVLGDICRRIWQKNPWLGTGLGSFGIDLRFYANAFDWSTISSLQSAPLNGYWLLLVERGVVGAFAVAFVFVLLVISYVRNFALSIRRLPHPMCLCGLTLVVLAAVETCGDSSFLLMENLILLLTYFTLSANAFSKGE